MIVHKISRTDEVARKRVAAYCRVSTGMAEQEESYERQVSHYERLIRANPAWEYAGVYADQGSGTRVEGRDGFKQLLADAMGSGEAACARVRHRHIDLILVKSISRFSRNMADCDRIVRELKAAVKKAEEAIEANEQRMAELEALLADPSTYEDNEKALRVGEEYRAEQEKTDALYEALEAAERAAEEAEKE